MRAILNTDGGARGNPGPSGIGVVLKDESGQVLATVARGIGIATNNVAEYTALIEGLELALSYGVTELAVRSDSELVVHQVKGEWKIKDEKLRSLAVRARSLIETFEHADIDHVRRSDNSEADRLANEGMDGSDVSEVDAETQSSLFEE